MNDKLYTYATTRGFGNFFMPVPAQNSCMREYAGQVGLIYVFPLVELYYENCHLQLFRLLEKISEGSEVCMYSALMLPVSKIKIEIIERIMSAKNLTFHFVFEKKKADTVDLLKETLEAYSVGKFVINEDINKIKNFFNEYNN